jgi:hypothetical protein
MPKPLQLGDRVRDQRSGAIGTFNGWRLLMGQRRALLIAGQRRWYAPADALIKPLTANWLRRKPGVKRG